jgi:hypothetical protein
VAIAKVEEQAAHHSVAFFNAARLNARRFRMRSQLMNDEWRLHRTSRA